MIGKARPGGRPPWWRRKWVINVKFQMKFWLMVVVPTVAAQVILYVILQSLLPDLRPYLESAKKSGGDLYLGILLDQQALFHDSFIWVLLSITILVSVIAVIVSNSIAGPIYRLCVELAEMTKAKKLRRFKFRKGDSFVEITTAFDALVTALESKSDTEGGSKNP